MSAAHTIGRWIRDRARTTPGRVAIDHLGRELTYVELDDASERLAASFLARGLKRGDRVATLTGNSPEHVAVFFACAKAGLILAPLSWRLAPAELAYQLLDSEPALFLVEDEHSALAEAAGRPSSRSRSSATAAMRSARPSKTTIRSCSSTPRERRGGRRARC